MKKTLLALAAVAAMGDASAQVTVSGSIAAGVQNTVADTKAKFHLTDADINFSAKEDLGGGMTAKASTSISNEKLRGNGTEANNTKLVLDGGFGTLEYVNKLSGKAKLSAGVSVEDDMRVPLDVTRDGAQLVLLRRREAPRGVRVPSPRARPREGGVPGAHARGRGVRHEKKRAREERRGG